jgi:hypothetical protein
MLLFEDCLLEECIGSSSTACSRSGIIIALNDVMALSLKDKG